MAISIYRNWQNMLNALFSIKPEYARQILSGKKKYEFRTRMCKKSISKIIIYETSPTSMIVGEVSILDVLKDTPEKIWLFCCKDAGIGKEAFMKYFNNHDIAYAYVLNNPVKYDRKISLSELNITMAPQSYLYIPYYIVR